MIGVNRLNGAGVIAAAGLTAVLSLGMVQDSVAAEAVATEQNSVAEKKTYEGPTDPRLEFGIFGATAYVPYYKGSSENRAFAFPFPYVVYRGEVIDLDEDSLTGHFFSSEKVVVDVSLYAEVNKSDDARIGMDELDEVMTAAGPAVKYYFNRKAGSGYDLYLSLPVRAAISGDWDDGLTADYRGLQSKIILYYENYDFLPDKQLEFVAGAAVGVIDSDLATYYYEVGAADATATRPEYKASGGYAGASVSLDMTYHIVDRFSIRAYANVDYLGGASFEDSPLVSETVNFSAGLAFIFSIWQSEDRVPRE